VCCVVRRDEGADILILARTDARQAVSLEEALWRATAFAGVGVRACDAHSSCRFEWTFGRGVVTALVVLSGHLVDVWYSNVCLLWACLCQKLSGLPLPFAGGSSFDCVLFRYLMCAFTIRS
jgi:hypothetical protein